MAQIFDRGSGKCKKLNTDQLTSIIGCIIGLIVIILLLCIIGLNNSVELSFSAEVSLGVGVEVDVCKEIVNEYED